MDWLKLAFISREYPPLSQDYPSYAQNYATVMNFPGIAEALVKRGHEIHVISEGRAEVPSRGVVIHRVCAMRNGGGPLGRLEFDLRAVGTLKTLVKTVGIQAVNTQVTFGDGFLPSVTRICPVVLYAYATSDMFLMTRTFSSLHDEAYFLVSRFAEDVSMNKASAVVSESSFMTEFLTNKKRVPIRKVITVLPSRFDLGKWTSTPSDIRNRLGIREDEILFLCVASLQPRKGIDVLVRSFGAIAGTYPTSRLVLIGSDSPTSPSGGSFKSYLVGLARELNVEHRILFVESHLPDVDLVRLYSSADVFVFPSLWEVVGYPILEALLAGGRVVATATGIVPDLLKMGVDIRVVEPSDANGLANAMKEALVNAGQHAGFDRRALLQRNFSFVRLIDSIESVNKRVIRSG